MNKKVKTIKQNAKPKVHKLGLSFGQSNEFLEQIDIDNEFLNNIKGFKDKNEALINTRSDNVSKRVAANLTVNSKSKNEALEKAKIVLGNRYL